MIRAACNRCDWKTPYLRSEEDRVRALAAHYSSEHRSQVPDPIEWAEAQLRAKSPVGATDRFSGE